MSAERWMPTMGYELAEVNGVTHVLKRGGRFVKERVPDDEVRYQTIAVAADYDEAVRIVRALRSTLTVAGGASPEGDDRDGR